MTQTHATTRSRLVTGPAPVLVLVLAAAVAAGIRGDFTDLYVYRYAGHSVLHGLAVYGTQDPVMGLPFSYPPFAAVAMVPLALVPQWLVDASWAAASVGALAGTVAVTRRALCPRVEGPRVEGRRVEGRRVEGRPTEGWLVAAVSAAALAMEPVWQTLTFGQVNLVLMLAVLVDTLHPGRRWSGVLVGIASGVKLTPLVFVVLLLVVGRRAAAGRAVATFAATIAIGFAAMPGHAVSYWTDGLFDATRVGPPGLAHNQSVYGALTRLGDGTPPTALWLGVALPVALAIMWVAARWWHRDRVLGSCLAAMAMLVLSPVSWSHHWVWAVPAALALWEHGRVAATAWVAVFVLRPPLWPGYGDEREYAWSPLDHVVGNGYLLAALALAGWAGVRLSSGAATPRPDHRRPAPGRRHERRPHHRRGPRR